MTFSRWQRLVYIRAGIRKQIYSQEKKSGKQQQFRSTAVSNKPWPTIAGREETEQKVEKKHDEKNQYIVQETMASPSSLWMRLSRQQ